MANAFSKEEVVAFEKLLEKFDPNNIVMRQVATRNPDMVGQERGGYTEWRPKPYISRTKSGLSLADADFVDMTQMSVPVAIDQIENVPWNLTAQDLNDPQQLERKTQSAAQALNAVIDTFVANLVGKQGTIVTTSSTALTGYDNLADAEASMTEIDVPINMDRTMILNPRDYNRVAGNLAERQTFTSKTQGAYERSYVGMNAGFDTFKASFQPRLGAYAGGSLTVTGAQSYIPAAQDGNKKNVDNRYMTLTVGASTANVKEGDAFTIAGVNSVGLIKKEDSGQAKTFRVISVDSGTTLTISPAIIPADGAAQSQKDYANVTTEAGAGAALTFLNTTDAQVNSFWVNDAIEITGGKLARPQGGVDTLTMESDSGIQFMFARQGAINDLSTKYRITVFFGATILCEEMCGIMLGGQS